MKLLLFATLCLCEPSMAQSLPPSTKASVIPHSSSWAINLMKSYALHSGVGTETTWPQSTRLVADHVYVIEPSDKLKFTVDALSGKVEVTDDSERMDISVEEAKRRFPTWKSQEVLYKQFLEVKDKVYPHPDLLNHLSPLSKMRYVISGGGNLDVNGQIVPGFVSGANLCYALFTSVDANGTKGFNKFDLTLTRDGGKIARFVSVNRDVLINTIPEINLSQAIEAARYYDTQGKPTPLSQKVGFEMNETEANFLREHSFTSVNWAKPIPQVEEDAWFLQRLVWQIDFITSVVTMNTRGELISAEPRDKWWLGEEATQYQKLFVQKQTTIYPAPPWLKSALLTKSKTTAPTVNFNGSELAEYDFFVPPIVQAGTSSIFVDYFPSFLIDVKREGAKITLAGQLPDKGKKAELTLGSTQAIVDGKAVTLSGAPQEIEGRVYLPYELLTLCNGVLTRWEPKKNTLSVDTRFLRRPD